MNTTEILELEKEDYKLRKVLREEKTEYWEVVEIDDSMGWNDETYIQVFKTLGEAENEYQELKSNLKPFHIILLRHTSETFYDSTVRTLKFVDSYEEITR